MRRWRRHRARRKPAAKPARSAGRKRSTRCTADPCPFCASSGVRPGVTEQGRVVVRCDGCGASRPVCIDELNAVRSWNRRPTTAEQDWD
ncbi:MAG: hypothetical protein EOS45_29820 [Mesorhizobium sp.]|nr:hypothetical protein EN779_18260 [Mesorhizobium sp. M4B.F.Ca.ET.088.02.2.1]RWF25844.1 MAG: hypothetical protein EOS45_29820 [Mesorhizobium sp.]